jgi:hypothetical protein
VIRDLLELPGSPVILDLQEILDQLEILDLLDLLARLDLLAILDLLEIPDLLEIQEILETLDLWVYPVQPKIQVLLVILDQRVMQDLRVYPVQQ